MFLARRQFRLAPGPDHPGLRCDADGVWLGGVPLLRKTDLGFTPRPTLEIAVLTKAGYGAECDTDKVIRGLAVAAQALNGGDLGRAMIATLHLRLPDLGRDRAASLEAVDAILAKYSQDQPRDWHGRWTTDGGGSVGQGQIGVPHPTAGHLIETGGADSDDGESPGIGDNSGLRPERAPRPDSDPDPALPQPKVPNGWDQPYRVINGKEYPAERIPTLSNGQPWPKVDPDSVLRALRPGVGTNQTMKIYVPLDHIGPILVGSNENGDFEQPPCYGVVYLRGTPQQTYSQGAETAHALKSVEKALEMAETNNFSDIYFNRTITVITSGGNQSSLRPDVAALYRPSLSDNGEFDVWEVFSPGQRGPKRERALRPVAPRMRGFSGQAYKLLLKLLRALGIS